MKYFTYVHWFKNACYISLCLCFLMQLDDDGHDWSKHVADIHCVLYIFIHLRALVGFDIISDPDKCPDFIFLKVESLYVTSELK